ncbi:hypothetical protein GYMLUDRAFT_247603 [Collybiopsis luxurians FD-317 M1]|uniref:Uncharacterized protein n=1 Tax=Collybiopsis luxurians FD-317 M1 TaxID=944289 RepID=A0A0D0BP26_9AGAR|nr:hypothetical protein GYMLUDRAFT_247603 [Collybiopsis luxurians FD-317 M1]
MLLKTLLNETYISLCHALFSSSTRAARAILWTVVWENIVIDNAFNGRIDKGLPRELENTVRLNDWHFVEFTDRPSRHLVESTTNCWTSQNWVAGSSSPRTLKSLPNTFIDMVHVKLGTDKGLGFNGSSRPLGGDKIPGVGGVADELDRDSTDAQQTTAAD